jgi:photosystem II stability/assembly factor-like uncharacterized protein
VTIRMNFSSQLLKRNVLTLCVFLFVFGFASQAQQYSEQAFSGMKWRQIGPFRGGRVLAVTGVPGDPATFYFGAVAGGVWKTIDAGSTWKPVADKAGITSVGAIAVSDSDHNVLYVGTGEACIRGNITYGNGVYKSVDSGLTWQHLGLTDTRHIGRLIVDPKNPNRVFVAALGHAFGPNTERGVFRTLDGGKTWEKVLYKDDHTGAIDIQFDPNNPNTLYAAMWQVVRQPWNLSSGGPGSGLYKSTDGGTTWARLEGHGLPDGIYGRIGVAVASNSSRVYALIEAKQGGIFHSDDYGATWTKINDDERFTQRAWYFTHIFADPKNIDTVYVLNTGAFRSTDGAKSFNLLPAPHGDHHGLWIDPIDTDRIINSNDGGATITLDGGKTWSTQGNQPTAQFYHIAADNRYPYWIYGAQQDNSTVGIATRDEQEGVIGRWDWYPVGGGESGYIAPDPRDANIVYAGDGGGIVTRYDHGKETIQDISPIPLDTSGQGAATQKVRFQWTEPIIISPNDPNTIYTAGDRIYKTTDQGRSWKEISPDLTRNDKSKQQPSGGPITLDITTVEYYDTVFTLAESPKQKDLLWAGTDDGLMKLSRDGGAHWEDVTPKALPEWGTVSLVEASPFDAGTAYIAVDRHKLDDVKPYIYKTHDFGKSWTAVTAGIPDGAYVHAVREDTVRKGLLFAGTEKGVYASFDDGANWQKLQLNLPITPIHDLVVHANDLAVATHGRAFWVLDDITPLRELGSGNTAAVLYRPADGYRAHFSDQVDKRGPVAENPPNGEIFDYYLNNVSKNEATLEILDASGKLVKKFSSQEKKDDGQPQEWPDLEAPPDVIPAKAGLNRFAWNLRYEDPLQSPGAFYEGLPPQGPVAAPGKYTVRLTMDGKHYDQPFELKADPRMSADQVQQIEQQVAFELQVRDEITKLHRTVNQMRELRGKLETLKKWLGSDEKGKPVAEAADALDKKMLEVEGQLIQVKLKSSEGNLRYPNMLNEEWATLSMLVDIADAAPTQQEQQVFHDLSRQTDENIAKWEQIRKSDVPALDELMHQSGAPSLAVE